LNRTGRIATVTIYGIAVVAYLARTYNAVAADDFARTRALPDIRWTVPVGLDNAGTITTIAGDHVSIVALLWWLVDPVAAAWRKFRLTTCIAGAVANHRARRHAA
jgi:hypothetical protein